MACSLTQDITKEKCSYSVAGVKAIYLINYDSAHSYTFGTGDAEKVIKAIKLSNSAKAYKVDFAEGTASFTDDLAQGGNGGKYRTHTVNFTIDDYDYRILNEGDALSLSKFSAVVVDKSGRAVILGRNNGLTATSFNYASGAGDADATGWTVVMAGTEIEMAPLLESEEVIKAIKEAKPITPTPKSIS